MKSKAALKDPAKNRATDGAKGGGPKSRDDETNITKTSESESSDQSDSEEGARGGVSNNEEVVEVNKQQKKPKNTPGNQKPAPVATIKANRNPTKSKHDGRKDSNHSPCAKHGGGHFLTLVYKIHHRHLRNQPRRSQETRMV